ncbi:hypothetical protein KY334_01165 [Candidatus Woesearchaeota archaeon]|nr:hypothetical protein [Candidatus Woesearchaeota archaeon]
MIKTPELEVICNELTNMELDDSELIHLYKQNNDALKDNKSHSFIHYKTRLSEVHTYGCLRKLSERYSFLKLKPLTKRNKKETENYTFKNCSHGNVVFSSKSNNENYAEFDNVSKVKDYLTIFETTFRSWSYLKESLMPSNIYKRVIPLLEIQDKDVGYVVIMNKNTYDSKKNETFIQEFTKSNGIIIPFYTTMEDFQKRVSSLIKEHKLPIKENCQKKNNKDELELEDIVL